MKLNNIVFPAPEPGYDLTHPNLHWIPKQVAVKNNFSFSQNEVVYETRRIPTIFVHCYKNLKSASLLIYFHGNAEDASYSEPMIEYLSDSLNSHAIIVEYPSYGVYQPGPPTEEAIYEDSLALYDFAVNVLKFVSDEIVVIGRSLGSGPATYLASKRKVKSLVLFSPYKSIRSVARDHVPLFGWMLQERFNNLNYIKDVEWPCFILHGQKDTIITCDHAKELFASCKMKIKELKTPLNMTHNTFNLNDDFIEPLKAFLQKIDNHKSLTGEQTKEDRPAPMVFLLDNYKNYEK
jgi:esterase/lipase